MRNFNRLQCSHETKRENASAHNYYLHIVSACESTQLNVDNYGPVVNEYILGN